MSHHKFCLSAAVFKLALLAGTFAAPVSAVCGTVKNENLQSAHEVTEINLLNNWTNNTQLIAGSGGRRDGDSEQKSGGSNSGGSGATSGATSGPTSGPGVSNSKTYTLTNKDKRVQISVQGNEIIAEGDSKGKIRFHIEQDAIYIGHLESNTPKSGIGAALMYAAAKEAIKNGKDIKISAAAPEARDFYKKMGFELDQKDVDAWVGMTGKSEEEVRKIHGNVINMYGERNTIIEKTLEYVTKNWDEFRED